MINVNKIEYFTKPNTVESSTEVYTFEKPWIRIYTAKGELEIPLSTEYDEEYYTTKFQELSKLSSGAKLNMMYDFRGD